VSPDAFGALEKQDSEKVPEGKYARENCLELLEASLRTFAFATEHLFSS